MLDTRNGPHGVPVRELVEMELTPEHVHAQTLLLNLEEQLVWNRTLDQLLKLRDVKYESAQVSFTSANVLS